MTSASACTDTVFEMMPGEAALTGAGYALLRAWEKLLTEKFGRDDPFIYAPAFLSEDTLERAKYLAHFPQHALKVVPHTALTTDTERYLAPASCLHVYPIHSGHELTEEVRYAVLGRCGRNESGVYEFPYRLSTFHMLEFVTIGVPEVLEKKRTAARTQIRLLFEELGLHGTLQDATDPFFAGEADGAAILQKIKGLKQEFVVAPKGKDVSLASINYHERHFTDAFTITMCDKTAASMCIAFGMERLVAYSASVWGTAPNRWPAVIQQYA